MLFRWLLGDNGSRAPTASDELRALVARSLPQADASLAACIGAVAGLLATVAHVDRVYSDAERAHVREALARIPGLDARAVQVIEALLSEQMAELAHESLQTYTRVLYEGLERGARLEVLDLLMDLAAADDSLDMSETNLLRRIASALGLTEDEYLRSQTRHRDKLAVLRPRG
jgi:uncharacterized tellurite resistance protein B-like protein